MRFERVPSSIRPAGVPRSDDIENCVPESGGVVYDEFQVATQRCLQRIAQFSKEWTTLWQIDDMT